MKITRSRVDRKDRVIGQNLSSPWAELARARGSNAITSTPLVDNRKYGPEIPAPRWNLSAMKSSPATLLSSSPLYPGRWLEQALTLFTVFGFRFDWPIDRFYPYCVNDQYPPPSLSFSTFYLHYKREILRSKNFKTKRQYIYINKGCLNIARRNIRYWRKELQFAKLFSAL